ncbi:MAG: uracil-DNA glycosylase [Oscillospiraceae bacterium]|nr:uracil-DNA glycosylase [Oscillospiraceae bacterium]
MINQVGNEWDEILKSEFESEYFGKLSAFLDEEYKTRIIYPEKDNIYNTLKFTPPDKVKVVILGQDPYINPGEAHGLAFSVQDGVKVPPSLKNIYKELSADIGMNIPKTGYLVPWANQGVLLLNTVLTVEAGKSNSHAKKGWEKFTDAVIKYLGGKESPIVFILWGKPSQSKEQYIVISNQHLILKAPHPSPLSASTGFFGCKHFSQANKFLSDNGLDVIDWDSVNRKT